MSDTLSSRDKNDIFWNKKRRYMVSSDLKNKMDRGYFNPDMVAEIKSAYDRYDNGAALHELTGDEFMDHPPTASGQIAFAKSIAGMMHTLDTLDGPSSDEAGVPDVTAAFFMDIIVDAGIIIRETINAFFMGCGVDEDGNEYHDIKKKKAAQEDFYGKRQEYEMLIKNERRIAGWEMIDIIRESNGIDEEMETDETGEDPALEKLVAENEAGVAEHKEEIEALRDTSRNSLIEAASLRAGRTALFMPVKKRLEDESQTEGTRNLLRGAFDSYLFDVDMRIRGLMFKSQAAYYMARWILLGEHVDEIIAERIVLISDQKPGIIDPDAAISSIPVYTYPGEDVNLDIPPYDDVDILIEMGDKVRKYIYAHPYQFEAQSLCSVVRDLNNLSEILPVSWALLQAIDKLTMSDRFASFTEEERQQIFDIFVISDMMCSIGYSITETIAEDPQKTIREATDILRSMSRMLSFYTEEKNKRQKLAKVIMERSGIRVY